MEFSVDVIEKAFEMFKAKLENTKPHEGQIQVGSFAKHYGVEYFKTQGLSEESSSEEIETWMKANNISFYPLFNLIGLPFMYNKGQTLRDLSQKVYDLAQSKGYKFAYDTVHISPSGTDLQCLFSVVV